MQPTATMERRNHHLVIAGTHPWPLSPPVRLPKKVSTGGRRGQGLARPTGQLPKKVRLVGPAGGLFFAAWDVRPRSRTPGTCSQPGLPLDSNYFKEPYGNHCTRLSPRHFGNCISGNCFKAHIVSGRSVPPRTASWRKALANTALHRDCGGLRRPTFSGTVPNN